MLRRRGRVAAAAAAVFHAELMNAAAALLARGALGQVALRGSGEEEDVPRRDATDGGRRSRRGRRQATEAVVGDGGVATPATLRRRSVASVDEVHRGDVSVLRLPALRLGRRRLGVLVGLSVDGQARVVYIWLGSEVQRLSRSALPQVA